MVYFDRQIDERESQNLRENEEERKSEHFRDMIVLLK